MYHSKKICFFISHIYGDYQMQLTSGIVSKAYEYGYPLEIYTTNDGEDLGDYSIGEGSILKIPNFDDIAGVLFASGTYVDETLKTKITELLKSHPEIPVIEITEATPVFTAVSMENDSTAGDLASHAITVHGARKICYLGHASHPYHSGRREQAYRDILLFNKVPVYDGLIYSCDGSSADYLTALNRFCAGGKPDAVICYNDNIALDFMECAIEQGYSIPGDFIITGCDNTEGGQNVTPSLTTVTFPIHEVGVQSVTNLVNAMSGATISNTVITAEPVYRESCGCVAADHINSFEYLRNRSKKIMRLEKSMLLSMKMSTALSHARDLDEGCDIIEEFISQIDKLKEFYLCLYSDWDRITDAPLKFLKDESDLNSDSIILKLGLKNKTRVPECSFMKTALLPEFVSADDNKAFLVTPLFFENREFGYVAMSFEAGTINFPFNLVQWITNIAQFLHDICEGELSSLMAQHLEGIYLKDALTGLSNRHGFNKAVDSLKRAGRYTSIIMIDLDDLKTINDTYGHEEGDYALKAIGQALLRVTTENEISARFGGDEFYCLITHDETDYPEKFVSQVEKYLANLNNLSGKPYKITASIGFETVSSFAPEDIPDLIKTADSKMYEIKKAKRNKK